MPDNTVKINDWPDLMWYVDDSKMEELLKWLIKNGVTSEETKRMAAGAIPEAIKGLAEKATGPRTLTEEEIRNSKIDIPGAIAAEIGKMMKEEAFKMKDEAEKPSTPPIFQVTVWVDTDAENDAVQDRYFALGKKWPGKDGKKKSALRQCFISVGADECLAWSDQNRWGPTHESKVVVDAQRFHELYPVPEKKQVNKNNDSFPRTWLIVKLVRVGAPGAEASLVGLALVECETGDEAVELFRKHTGSKESVWSTRVSGDIELAGYKRKYPNLLIIAKDDKPNMKTIGSYTFDASKVKKRFLPGDYQSIEKDLAELINKQSRENRSDTPDFILAQYMARCLKAFEDAVNARTELSHCEEEIARVAGPQPCATCGTPTVLGRCSKCWRGKEEWPLHCVVCGKVVTRPQVIDAIRKDNVEQPAPGRETIFVRCQTCNTELGVTTERGALVSVEVNPGRQGFCLRDPNGSIQIRFADYEEADKWLTENAGKQVMHYPKGKFRIEVGVGGTDNCIIFDIGPEGSSADDLLKAAADTLRKHGMKATMKPLDNHPYPLVLDQGVVEKALKEYERENKGQTITTTVSNCARCGGTHENLKFTQLSGEPIGEYTHWATCPKTGEPIALLITMQMGKEGYDPK